MSILGGVSMDLIVAQGCRPLSDITWTVERVDREFNTILALRREGPAGSSSDGKQVAAFTGETVPLMALQMELQGVVSSKEQLGSILNNLTLGVAPDTLSLQPKDFLIRPMSITQEGSLAVGEYVRVGQRIRFMIRDQQGAREDLQSHGIAYKKRQLVASLAGQGQEEPVGMMVFSCNGRGSSLYQEPSYDTRTVSSFIPVPCSGFLCNGEIGGLRGSTHLHGFTCVVGVIRAANQAPAPTPVEETIETKEAANKDITEFKRSE
ncbi:hypothetical protein CEUSTIGMA_g3137.t1 [Chlamydomonas eustigma]|uniref:FIST C-domain domain-containing protein n=1 Tax=Chlamydomonas eustigma TaxID=1157962 RepID=A0A250WXX5_9CHLO|nr:hypothetical protein CEUSTIGMA_g3137.t1 [Chlamydomonas eustigma]|eukprot:GAX75694.1 hypothetical protein CEUSTIGMA_g3137.t1 [Chlamydomonas eustigma]